MLLKVILLKRYKIMKLLWILIREISKRELIKGLLFESWGYMI
jgi:hypothetical protein